ncbi:MAG: hypothetical protein ACR2G7_07265 [Acidimicrobiales bacterium]
MEVTTARDLIDELDDVRRQARRDRRVTSVPLLTFGVLTLLNAVTFVREPNRGLYWLLAGPAGFGLIAWYYRRHEVSVGVGSAAGTYGRWALGLLAALVLLPVLILFGAPFGLIALGLLIIAIRQRNRYLGAWAVVYGVLGVLEGFSFLTNRVYDLAGFLGYRSGTSSYFSWAPSLVTGLLGLMLVGAGLVALRHEVGREKSTS